MFMKALIFRDFAQARKIAWARTPAAAKKMGKEIRGFDGDIWAAYVESVALECVWQKFYHLKQEAAWLRETGENSALFEAAASDPRWGVGLKRNDFKGKSPAELQVTGANILGKALMVVRDRLNAPECMPLHPTSRPDPQRPTADA